MITDDSYFVIDEPFRQRIFSEFLTKYSFRECKNLLNKSHGTIYLYRNGRVRYIPYNLLCRLATLLSIDFAEIKKHCIEKIEGTILRKRGLLLGQEIRTKKAKQYFKSDIEIADFVIKDQDGESYLNLEKWLEKTQWINKLKKNGRFVKKVHSGDRPDCIHISYECYNRYEVQYRRHEICLPKKIRIDIEFMYFLGLHFGDGVSSGRIGVINKDYNIINFSANFIRKLTIHQATEGVLFLYKNRHKINKEEHYALLKNLVDKPKFHESDKPQGDFAFSVFITNATLSNIFLFLERNLLYLISLFKKEYMSALLAGIFDAEGNVNKLYRMLRISQLTEWKKHIINELLIRGNYHTRYDGASFLIGFKNSFRESDFRNFKENIFPFLIHSEKLKEASELLNGNYVREDYKIYVEIISKLPGITNKQLTEHTGKTKNQQELRSLVEQGFIRRKRTKVDESFKYYTTLAGILWLNNLDYRGEGSNDYTHILLSRAINL